MSSWLLVDADGIDAVPEPGARAATFVIDLTRRSTALRQAGRWLAAAISRLRGGAPRANIWILVAPLDSGRLDADLAAIMPAAPDGIVLPGCRSGRDIQHLGGKLAVREAEAGLNDGATRVVAMLGTPISGLLDMNSLAGSSRRLAGITWNREALAAELGIDAEAGAELPAPLALARTLTVLAAAAAGVPAIDAACRLTDAHFAAACREARQDGFVAKMTRDPAQIPIIDAVFGKVAEQRPG